ncbi:NAD(P)-dependent oxidoreductase [Candidatus Daviesbacteria bacterium]|nr:NAD(P)-dependent oxidoreductase [Candidatus Daviesbacteria bacterium]
MKVLVTGGRGRISSGIIKRLSETRNYQIYATSRPSSPPPNKQWSKYARFLRVDLTNQIQTEKLFKLKFDAVVHLAGLVKTVDYFQDKPATVLLNNLKIDTNVFSQIQKAKVKRIIFLSTINLFHPLKIKYFKGGEIKKIPVPEDGYDFSKLTGEILCKTVAKELGIEYVILRPMGHLYGPSYPPETKNPPIEEIRKSQITYLIHQMLKGKSPLEAKGNPDQKRTWVHIYDLADAVTLALEKKSAKNGDFYIGSNESVSLREIAKKLYKIIFLNQKRQVEFGRSTYFRTVNFKVDYLYTKRVLGWEAKYNVKNSLPELVEWIRKYFI